MGPPGSGKSSHAAALEAQDYLRISQDEQGRQHHLDLFQSHVTTGRDMVVDRMNFDKAQRDRYRLEAIKNGYEVNIIEFVTPRQVCYDRCMAREGHPTINGIDPEDGGGRAGIIMSSLDEELHRLDELAKENQYKSKQANSALGTFFSRYEEIDESEYSEVLRIYWNAPEKSDAVMIDIDGTLANLDHRLHHVKGEGKKDWGAFFRECGKDLVYPDTKRIMDLEFEAGTSVVLCSGRPSDYREQTEKWLTRNEINYMSLKMRPHNNFKQDSVTKVMLYRYEIKPFYNILYILDDRSQVVEAWRKIGLVCHQVRPGDF